MHVFPTLLPDWIGCVCVCRVCAFGVQIILFATRDDWLIDHQAAEWMVESPLNVPYRLIITQKIRNNFQYIE